MKNSSSALASSAKVLTDRYEELRQHVVGKAAAMAFAFALARSSLI
jgi:hypothetical protein